MKQHILILLAGCMFIIAGCHKKRPDLAQSPQQTTLIFPAQNEVCTQGTIISPTQSSVVFSWKSAENTDNYDLVYKNLLTSQETTQNTGGTQLAVTLLSNTPYSWYIRSKSSAINTTAKSDTWKFYNAGQATTNYAPFPADIVSPAMLDKVSGTSITFKWNGADADGDPLTYDLYCSSATSPVLIKAGLTTSTYSGFSVTSGTTYYWKVITNDNHGNSSDSGVYRFSVN
jgi:hypothetical protein